VKGAGRRAGAPRYDQRLTPAPRSASPQAVAVPASVRAVSAPIFRLVCVPAALDGAPGGWASDMLADGEIALLVDDGGLAAVDAVAHELDLVVVSVLRTETTAERQERTVMAYAAALPLVWVAPRFGDEARRWARERGPMTLLVEQDGALPEPERRRIERFVAALGRQVE
jgi:hypothetical protein